MRIDLTASGQCRDGRIGTADATAADGDEEIAIGIKCFGDRGGIARSGFGEDDFRAPTARAFGDQICRDRAARNIDDAQARTAYSYFFKSRGACDQEIGRQHLPAGLGEEGSSANIATGPTNPLPRYRFRQYLDQRSCLIDRISIDHTVTVFGNRIAGLDPWRRRGERQRRVGGCADQIAGTQRLAVDGCDIMRRIGAGRRHLGCDAAQRLAQRKFDRRNRHEIAQQDGQRDVERGERGRQALDRVHKP